MGWMPPPTASKYATLVMLRYQAKEKASMEKATVGGEGGRRNGKGKLIGLVEAIGLSEP